MQSARRLGQACSGRLGRFPWRSLLLTSVIALLGHGGIAPVARADTEAWADPSLPVKKGLMLWLDATRQPAAWQKHGKPPLGNGSDLDVCYDGSGHHRHFSQSIKGAQPRYVSGKQAAAIRFDGENDALHRGPNRQELGHFTAVVAVAPRSNAGGFRAILSATETGKNDYTSGLNVDLGPFGSAAFDVLNVEGRGFGGFRNLFKASAPLRQLQVVALTGDDAAIKGLLNG